jgi:hypothetical protein
LLHDIIDESNNFNRESVQDLFHHSSKKDILQEILGKYSTINKDKLKALMNDPDAKEIIHALFKKEGGILPT